MKVKKTLRPVEVVWDDAACDESGWVDADRVREFAAHGAKRCYTVGYLVARTKKRIVIVQGFHTGHQFMNTVTIPRGWVVSVRNLK